MTREGAMRLLCLPKPHVPPVGPQSKRGQDQQAVWQSSKPSYQETGSITPLPPPHSQFFVLAVLLSKQGSRAKLKSQARRESSPPLPCCNTPGRDTGRGWPCQWGGPSKTEDDCKMGNLAGRSFHCFALQGTSTPAFP